jgi:hypothetical protein
VCGLIMFIKPLLGVNLRLLLCSLGGAFSQAYYFLEYLIIWRTRNAIVFWFRIHKLQQTVLQHSGEYLLGTYLVRKYVRYCTICDCLLYLLVKARAEKLWY